MFGGALDSNAKEDLKNLPRGTVGEGEGEGQKKSSFLVNSKWQVCSQLPNFNPGPARGALACVAHQSKQILCKDRVLFFGGVIFCGEGLWEKGRGSVFFVFFLFFFFFFLYQWRCLSGYAE